MGENIRKTFAQEIDEMKLLVVEMGRKAEELLKGSIKALIEKDIALADRTIAEDEEVDDMEQKIEAKCMLLLALQQPMAIDLRTIGSVLKIITDIERLADHSTKISKKAKILSTMAQIKPYVDLPKMAGQVIEMLRLSIDAFVSSDVDLAYKVIEMDDSIDDFNHKIFAELVEIMIRDREVINYVSQLMVIVQSLERVADHVTNICERIIYVSTGVLPKLN